MFLWYPFVSFRRAARHTPRVSFRHLLCNIFSNDSCAVINRPNCLYFPYDLRVCRPINSPSNYLLLQSYIDCILKWCAANFMKPNFSKIRVISFTRKTNVLNYQHRLGNSFILLTDYIKDLGVQIGCKLHFHHHVDLFFHMH
jgi:hypothetical protein